MKGNKNCEICVKSNDTKNCEIYLSIYQFIFRDADVISRGPTIHYGKTPQALPDLPIAEYLMGPETITAACTGNRKLSQQAVLSKLFSE